MGAAQAVRPVVPIDQRGYAHPEVLVSTEWAAAHLTDPKVRLVESNEDILLYDTGHIPGAVKLDWTTDLNDPVVRDYIDRERLAEAAAVEGHQRRHDDRLLRRQEQLVGHVRALGAPALRRRRTSRSSTAGGSAGWRKGRKITTDVPSYPRRQHHASRARRREDPRVPRRGARAPEAEGPAGGRAEPRGVPRRAHPHARVPAGGSCAAATSPAPRAFRGPRRWIPETRTFRPAGELREALRTGQRLKPERGDDRLLPDRRAVVATPGLCSPTCSASTRCATTTGRGPSGAMRCACRWRSS